MLVVLLVVVGVIAAILLSIKKAYKVHKSGYILITGASSGIGLHAAEHMAKHHKFTVLAGVRKEKDAQEIRNKKIPNLHPIIIDVNHHDSVVKCAETVRHMMKQHGLPFVALVNNAGINRHLPLEFNPIEDVKAVYNTNVFGTLECIQQFLPMLRESQGRVINMSSVSGFLSVPTMGIYSSSKFAIEGITDALRREVNHLGVSVSVVQPAFVKTNIQNATEAMSTELVKDPEVNARMRQVYAKFFGEASKAKVAQLMAKAETPVVTTRAIEHALTARCPKTRYPVSNSNGVPSTVLTWLIWLANDRLNDILVENK